MWFRCIAIHTGTGVGPFSVLTERMHGTWIRLALIHIYKQHKTYSIPQILFHLINTSYSIPQILFHLINMSYSIPQILFHLINMPYSIPQILFHLINISKLRL